MALIPMLNGVNLGDILTCPICLDIYDDPRVFVKCQHTFCRKCIEGYIKRAIEDEEKPSMLVCPFCRDATAIRISLFRDLPQELWASRFPKNYIASDLIANLKDKNEYCEKHSELKMFICKEHLEICCAECLFDVKHKCKIAGCLKDDSIVKTEEFKPKFQKDLLKQLDQLQSQIFDEDLEKAFEKRESTITRLQYFKRMLDDTIEVLQQKQDMATYERQNFDMDLQWIRHTTVNSKTIFELVKCRIDIRKLKRQCIDTYHDILSSWNVKKLFLDLEKASKEEVHELCREEFSRHPNPKEPTLEQSTDTVSEISPKLLTKRNDKKIMRPDVKDYEKEEILLLKRQNTLPEVLSSKQGYTTSDSEFSLFSQRARRLYGPRKK